MFDDFSPIQKFFLVIQAFQKQYEAGRYSNEETGIAILGAASMVITMVKPEEADTIFFIAAGCSRNDFREEFVRSLTEAIDVNAKLDSILNSFDIKGSDETRNN